jgi:hypothetical protein
VALANLMRLSLLKAAHAVVSGAAYRKSGSPVLFVPGTLWRTWGTRPVPKGFCQGTINLDRHVLTLDSQPLKGSGNRQMTLGGGRDLRTNRLGYLRRGSRAPKITRVQ